MIAREKGLEGLCDIIMGQKMKGSIEENAEKFINAEKGVETVEEAIEGAKDIACEIIKRQCGNTKSTER